MAKNKTLKVLSTGTVAGMIAAAVLSSQAFAAVDAYSVKIGDDVLKYDKAALTESFLASKAGEAAPLYEDFTAKLTEAKGFYAFSDAKTGKFVSYDDIQAKFLEAKAAGEAFVVDAYTESADAKVVEIPTVKKVVVKDGKVVVESETAELKVEAVSAINAKTLEVKFSNAVDTTKAKIVVKKGTVTTNTAKITYSDDKKSAQIELSSKLTEGDYTITVSGLTDTAISTTITAQDEKVNKIELLSDKAIINGANVEISYKVYNQYGEDITKITSGIVGTSNLGTVTPDASNSLLSIPTGTAKAGDKYTLAVVHPNTGVSTSGTIIVSDAAAVADVAISTLYNADGKELNEDSTVADFKLVVDVKDQYGNTLKAANATSDLLVTVSDTTIASVAGYNATASTATFGTTKIDGTDKVTLTLNGTLKAGKTKVTLISKSTGKLAAYEVVVKDGVKVDTMTLSAPDIAAVGEDAVIQIDTRDTNGNAVNKTSEFAGTTVQVTNTAGTTTTAGTFKLNPSTNKVELVIPTAALGIAKGKAIVTVKTETNKIVMLNLDVKEAAVPTSIVGFDTDSKVKPNLYISEGVTIEAKDIIVEDQYGRVMSDSKLAGILGVEAAGAGNNGKYIVKFSTTDSAVVVGGTNTGNITADALNNVTFTAGATKGTATIKAELFVGAAGAYGKVNGSDFTYDISVKDKKEIVSYEVKELGKVYDDAAIGYKKDIVVYGILANGTKIVMPTSSYSVTSSKSTLTYAAGQIDANGVITGTDIKNVDVTLNIVIDGEDGPVTLTKVVTVTNEAPKVVEVKLASTSDITLNGTGITGSAANLADETKIKALITVVDQYGEENASAGLTTPTITFTNIYDANTTNAVTLANNGTTIANIGTLETGDTYNVTLVYGTTVVTLKATAN